MSTAKKSFSTINIKQFLKKNWLYAAVFLTPLLLLSAVGTFQLIGLIEYFPFLFTWKTIGFNGIAAVFFLFYLSHTDRFSLGRQWQFLFSIAYALCPYGVLGQKRIAVLLVYAIFPLVFYSYEQMTGMRRFLPFLLFASLSLMLSPGAFLPVMLLLWIFSFFLLSEKKLLTFANALHVLCCFLLSGIVSSFRLLSYLAPYYVDHDSYGYGGFSMILEPLPFLSRFMPGVSPAATFYDTPDSADLGFGLLFFILFCCFFFQKNIAAKKRICYGVFTVLVLAAAEISPVKYLLNLCIDTGKPSLSYSFFVVFWCLLLACEAVSRTDSSSYKSVLFGCGLTLLAITGVLIGSSNNFQMPVLLCLYALCLLYGILLFFSYRKKTHAFLFWLLLFLVCLESGANIAVVSSSRLYAKERGNATHYLWETGQQANESPAAFSGESLESSKLAGIPTISEFYDFLTAHTDPEFSVLYDQLRESFTLSDQELSAYSDKKLPNYFETANAYFQALGYQKEFFVPIDLTPSFDSTDDYILTEIGNGIYNFMPSPSLSNRDSYFALCRPLKEDGLHDTDGLCLHMYCSSYVFNCDYLLNEELLSGKAPCYIPFVTTEGISTNVQILFYAYDREELPKLASLLDAYEASGATPSILSAFDYTGICVSLAGLFCMFALFFNSDKEKLYKKLFSLKERCDSFRLPKRLAAHIRKYYVYYLSFLLPLLFFVGGMIFTDCMPFGGNHFFDSDGAQLTVPSYMDYYYNMQQGNSALTLNAGYGSSISATNPSLFLLFFYRLFDAETIPVLLLLGEAFCIGLSGFFMTWYMTHRLRTHRAYFRDYRLLLPALVYALNGYMLTMHSFPSWYFALCAFPLLMLAMDYLMEKGKCFLYIFVLGFCIIMNLQLAMYMCIFLVISFFTYRFDSLRGFFKKGIRFASCSLLGAGIGFYSIANTVLETYDSPYKEKDSVFPSFGLHMNFLDQWKKSMIFTYSDVVTNNDGEAVLYFGVFCLFLLLVFFCAKKYTLRQKLVRLVPLLILCISFNGQALSYLWNGFHYQSMVPNRYVFLLGFLIAETAYDGFCRLKEISRPRLVFFAFVVSGFFILCQYGGEGVSRLSFIASLCLCAVYVLLTAFPKKPAASKALAKVFTFTVCLELFANMLYANASYNLDNLSTIYLDYQSIGKTAKELFLENTDFARISYPASLSSSSGMMYNTPCTTVFNSYITEHQKSLSRLLGFYHGLNVTVANHDSTPFGNMLSANKYLFVGTYGTQPLLDLASYSYQGLLHDAYHVYENERTLPLGFYAPASIGETAKHLYFSPFFYDNFVKMYTKDDRNLFEVYGIEYDQSGSSEFSFYFTDTSGKKVSYEQAEQILLDNTDIVTEPLYKLYMHINFTPTNSGQAYLYADELAGLGEALADKPSSFTAIYPNTLFRVQKSYYVVVMNEEVLDDFYGIASKNVLADITYGNDTITGTTDYEKDGYTLLSLAYDRSWHAYIDGEEVGVEDPFSSCIAVKTPAGRHTLTLKYIPYMMKECKLISLGFLLFALTLAALKRKKK